MIGPVTIVTLVWELFPTSGGPDSFSVVLRGLVAFFVWVLLWVGFASVLHARFLDRRHSPPVWRALIWSRTQLEFLFGIFRVTLVLILVGVVAGIPIAIAGAIATWLGILAELVGLLVASYVWARLAMVFPSASVGKPLAIKDSWSLTSSAVWRIAFLLGLLYIVSRILVPLALSLPLLADVPSATDWLVRAVSAALMFGGAAVVAAILSATYQALVETRPPDVRDTYIPQDGTHLADAF